MIDTIVFDIGNVLVGWDPRHLYRKVFATEAEMERFLAEVCTNEWHLAHDRGVSFEENGAKLKVLHPDHAAHIDFWHTRYAEMIPGRIAGMPVPVFEYLRATYPELQRFETAVISGAEGVLKPDPRLYEILMARAGFAPERAYFIDDSKANIAAADALGFQTHHFTDAATLAKDLAARGLLV